MEPTFDYFMNESDPNLGYPADDYHLVQQWAWFSLDETSFEWGTTHSALYDPAQKKLTSLGQAFANYAAGKSRSYIDLYPGDPMLLAGGTAQAPLPFGGQGDIRFKTAIYNNGSTRASGTVSVERLPNHKAPVALGTQTAQEVPSRYRGTRLLEFNDHVTLNGPLHYRVQVHAANDVRPGNDILTSTITLDVALTAVAAEGTGYATGLTQGRVSVSITVSNNTSLPLANVPVQVVDATQPTVVLAAGEITTLPAKGKSKLFLNWLMPIGRHRIRAIVDPANTVSERDETNNEAETEVWIAPHRELLPIVMYKGAL